MDPECKMFYDACGYGTSYKLCNGISAQKTDSSCGAVLYQKGGKQRCFDFYTVHATNLTS